MGDNGHEPISLNRSDFSLSPGILDPLCGWHWIESRLHPIPDNSFVIIAGGVRSRITLSGNKGQLREIMRGCCGKRIGRRPSR